MSVDINGVFPKTGTCEGSEHMPTQLAAFTLAINIFLCFVHRVNAISMYLETGLQSSLLCTQYCSSTEVQSPCSDSVTKIAADTPIGLYLRTLGEYHQETILK